MSERKAYVIVEVDVTDAAKYVDYTKHPFLRMMSISPAPVRQNQEGSIDLTLTGVT
jgi:hypothetical protein